MRLHLDMHTESRMGIDEMLANVGARISARPELAQRDALGITVLRCPLPPDYQPRHNRDATELRARISSSGHLFEISECSDSVSGGWMASCIPTSVIAAFLRTWLDHNPPQMDMFT